MLHLALAPGIGIHRFEGAHQHPIVELGLDGHPERADGRFFLTVPADSERFVLDARAPQAESLLERRGVIDILLLAPDVLLPDALR